MVQPISLISEDISEILCGRKLEVIDTEEFEDIKGNVEVLKTERKGRNYIGDKDKQL